MTAELRIISCLACPCGQAAGVGTGGRCPLVDRQHRRGEYLYFEGAAADRIWFVKRGTVVLSRALGDGERADSARAVRRAGAFVGLEALVQPVYADSARVASAATLCSAPLAEIDAWLGPRSAPARMALEQSLRASCRDQPRAAARDGSAVSRVARWLAGEQGQEQAAPIQRRDVAGLLGMVPETFSRALAELARRGAVTATRTTLRITDREALMAAARLGE